MNKKILVITTGGTIAMKKFTKDVGAVPALTGSDLIELVPGLKNLATLEVSEYCNIPSPFMTPEKMFELAKYIEAKIIDYDGVVVTHGTDTVEETSYLVDLIVNTKKPIVFTAAMRSNDEVGLDGPRNLLDAVRVASSEYSGGRGVMLVISSKIFSVREVYKTSTGFANAFGAPNYGFLGMVDADEAIFYRRPEIRENYDADNLEKNVDAIKVTTGDDRKFIDCAILSGAKGLVIEAFGRGNVPPVIQDAIYDAIKEGIVVVITSRVPNGRVKGVYGYPGGGKSLEKIGAIMGGDLNSEKARLKLMVLMGMGMDRDSIRSCFENFFNFKSE
ncbi:MAG: L-asparaginase [Candidatus Cloacimonadota bacterium]|nr:MAG: L-asparaginase [Candidatus Cloacimonadota bacterium]PIE82041.1 MAG: L-asparaginase [Candidatus Delongbacteria bacterium]